MTKSLLQYLLPHHAISTLSGWLANSEQPQLKSFLIARFMKNYAIDMSEANVRDPKQYRSFNDFFTRHLKQSARPINQDQNVIVSPADGNIAEIGYITNNRLIQAKGHDFSLLDLVGGDKQIADAFTDGSFATIYLAPHNYHRVHLPYDSKLVATYFIPGRLFSVNLINARNIPALYSRNERLVCLFEHERLGKIAVILVGAMIVGSIQLVFEDNPVRSNEPITTTFDHPHHFKKGDEIAHFKLGSTVILLFEKNKVSWDDQLHAESNVMVGMALGKIETH